MTTPMFVALTLLADKPSQTGPEFGKASPIGLLIVVLLLIATCVLVWSMNKHLKRLPKTFDTEAEQDQAGTADGGHSETRQDTPEGTAEKPAHEPGG